jgi:ethanolamine ammonia-lyase large subunit
MNILTRLMALSPLPRLTASGSRSRVASRVALTTEPAQRARETNVLEVESEITRQLMADEINQGTYRFLIETLAAHQAATRPAM